RSPSAPRAQNSATPSGVYGGSVKTRSASPATDGGRPNRRSANSARTGSRRRAARSAMKSGGASSTSATVTRRARVTPAAGRGGQCGAAGAEQVRPGEVVGVAQPDGPGQGRRRGRRHVVEVRARARRRGDQLAQLFEQLGGGGLAGQRAPRQRRPARRAEAA